MTPFRFKLHATDGPARLGTVTTPHGAFDTPMFMPVGTQGTVKGLTPAQVADCGTRILLGNTYHLTLRPGDELIAELGGLHAFMHWPGPILTDSGGYQVFSLAERRKITDAGAKFHSHIDGRALELTPEKAVEIQQNLGSDIAMVLDECPPGDADEAALTRRRPPHAVVGGALQETPHPTGAGAVRHHAGGDQPRDPRGARERTRGDGLPRLRAGRIQRRRVARSDARRPARVRRDAAGAQADAT